jgi:hypothetical protein
MLLCSVTLDVLLDRPERLVGNVADEELADNMVGHERANQGPGRRKVVHDTDVYQWPVGVQKPGYDHPPADTSHMGEVNLMPKRVETLMSRPAHRKTIAMRRHLDQAVCSMARENLHPAVMWQQPWPVLYGCRHGKNPLNISTDIDTVFGVHGCCTIRKVISEVGTYASCCSACVLGQRRAACANLVWLD